MVDNQRRDEPAQTDDRKVPNAQQSPTPPAISLPKGGGAIRGIGEKFTANPVTGTGSMSVPIATSPGRSGFGPQLALSYDSGAGNGPFGLGWSLSLPSITRKTDKGLPQYRDAEESDVFILSGAEDLVPEFQKDANGDWVHDAEGNLVRYEGTTTAPGYTIHRYRPRVEGLFVRIERWTRQSDDDVHWRSISKDNILTLYGKDAESRIFDPDDPRRIFSWLICETRDDKGNVVVYEYKAEDGTGVDLTQAHERNRGDRDDPRRTANRYLKRIRYGNRTPLLNEKGQRPRFLTDLPPDLVQNAGWMFEVVFDYGEHDADAPKPDDAGQWIYRLDPFSNYRAGFEVRACRLCQRVLMFHHIPDISTNEKGYDGLVRSTDFTYSYEQDPTSARNPVYTFLLEVTQSGYKPNDSGYLKRSLPPVGFEYSQPVVQDAVEEVDTESLENLPVGLDGAAYHWVDLDGEGLSGILTEQGSGWYYKPNLSPLPVRPEGGREKVVARFGPLERVAEKPSLGALNGGRQQLLDLAGDGQLDLALLDGPTPGFYERTHDERWASFRAFRSLPNVDWNDPNLRFVDLTGDGHADILVTEEDVFTWYLSLAEAGFGPDERARQALDEEEGPRLVFADGSQSIYLADLSGDGLPDLARVRNGEVCYWPNLGYGRFGAKVTMDNSPHFDHPEQFSQKRVRLADVDGSGTTDIIYLHRDGVRLYFNQSGNSWSAPQVLSVFPRTDDLVSIVPTDLLGNGTACLVWSSPLPGDATRVMRYVNLMGERKPHLLVKTVNNLGAETHVEYAPSTKFYLADKQAGKPWITRLPFPVHVVERVETYDRISRNRFVTRYAYHHGHFDGVEREFRGFGMVEQWDTEEIGQIGPDEISAEDTNLDEASFVPPVVTKTWFHTGAYLDRDHISNYFAGIGPSDGEYYREPGLDDKQAGALLLPDTVLPAGLTVEEEREACRALKGAMLRQEVYALDGTAKADHPYTVAEQNFTIRCLQPQGRNRYAVFFTHAREALSYHYERNPKDPRISHALTLEVDGYGNVLKSASIAYGRRQDSTAGELPAEDRKKQRLIHIIYTENRFTKPFDPDDLSNDAGSIAIDESDVYRTPLPAESRTYELRQAQQEQSTLGQISLFQFDDVLAKVIQAGDGQHDVSYEDLEFTQAKELVTNDPGQSEKYFRRLIEHVCNLYRPDDLGQAVNDPLMLLPLGTVQPLALPGESYQLAFTPGLLKLYAEKMDLTDLQTTLADEGRYVELDGEGGWWIPSGRLFYSADKDDPPAQELAFARQHFFLPHRFRDPFHTTHLNTETTVAYDTHDLAVLKTTDPLDNQVSAAYDYRVLQPWLMTGPNGNRSAVAFDALGMVAGTAVMGKPLPDPVEGDSLAGFEADLTQAQIDEFYEAEDPHVPAPSLLKGATTRIIYDLDRFRRTRQAHPEDPAQWLPVYAATLARETHVSDPLPPQGLKIQISFSYSDGFGREIQQKLQAEPGPLVEGGPEVSPRWVGSGWTIFNNKGKPVRQYEPFFSQLPAKRHHFEFGVQVGVSPILFYDPLERVVATLHPNHTYEKAVFDPWRQVTWDVNDTVLGDPRTDADIRGYTAGYFASLPASPPAPAWDTWHAQRAGGALGVPEQNAAAKATVHADTPTVAHFDTLGRPFLTVVHNRFEEEAPSGMTLVDEPYPTRVELDIEGNTRAVIDARDRIVMAYDYDMLGAVIHSTSMDAGERWLLQDVAGQPLRSWDSRDHTFRTEYDALHRPVRSFVLGADPQDPTKEILFERTEYGEGQLDDKQLNLRTRVFKQYDGAGIVTHEAYDFKGNLLRSNRELAEDYHKRPDWAVAQPPGEKFSGSTTYDALNRPLTMTTPDQSVIRPTYNEANLLDAVEVNLRGEEENGQPKWTPFVTNINYNARGQRELIAYGTEGIPTYTYYTYDPLTFRLIRLNTTRPSDPDAIASQLFQNVSIIQDLRYTYDPAGNITRIEDAALKTVFHNNAQVEPVCSYTYDAIYRLIEARGREHIGQTAHDFNPPDGNRRDYPFVGLPASPNDLLALRNYSAAYEYDGVGNILKMSHSANGGSWTRHYEYATDSNRLLSTSLPGDGPLAPYSAKYAYDAHGSMIKMPHLAEIQWDFEDQMQQVDLGGGGTAYYVYDAGGQRARKVIERQNGSRKEERLYLGGFELYREYNGNGSTLELERETLHIMDDTRRIALVETKTIDSQSPISNPQPLIRYQFDNHLGSASLELDEQAKVIAYEEYYPYGSTAYQAGRSQTEVKQKRYRYTGKERDEETGLYYHGARYYAPWLGRWMSVDPAGLVEGTNLYIYAQDNPVVLIDPDGTVSVLIAAQKTRTPRETDERAARKKHMTVEELRKLREDEDKNFWDKAGTRLKSRMEKDSKKFKAPILAKKVETGEAFLNVLIAASKKGPITNLVIYGHSGSTGVYMREDAGFYRNPGDVKEKPGAAFLYHSKKKENSKVKQASLVELIKSGKIKFSKDAVVIFLGCKCAGESSVEQFSLAREFTKSTGVTSIASVKSTNQSYAKNRDVEYSEGKWVRFTKSRDTVQSKVLTEDNEGKTPLKNLDPLKFLQPEQAQAKQGSKQVQPKPRRVRVDLSKTGLGKPLKPVEIPWWMSLF